MLGRTPQPSAYLISVSDTVFSQIEQYAYKGAVGKSELYVAALGQDGHLSFICVIYEVCFPRTGFNIVYRDG